MKPLKPGQICTIDGVRYRAKQRTNGCSGCALDSFFRCPSIVSKNYVQLLDCYSLNIILVKV